MRPSLAAAVLAGAVLSLAARRAGAGRGPGPAAGRRRAALPGRARRGPGRPPHRPAARRVRRGRERPRRRPGRACPAAGRPPRSSAWTAGSGSGSAVRRARTAGRTAVVSPVWPTVQPAVCRAAASSSASSGMGSGSWAVTAARTAPGSTSYSSSQQLPDPGVDGLLLCFQVVERQQQRVRLQVPTRGGRRSRAASSPVHRHRRSSPRE